MIMKMFPKKPPSKITQYAQTLAIFSTVELGVREHGKFWWPRVVSLGIVEIVVLDVNDMIYLLLYSSTVLSLLALQNWHTLRRRQILPQMDWNFAGLKPPKEIYIKICNLINFPLSSFITSSDRIYCAYKR